MKGEWCTVGPDDNLYVGSTGKDWTDGDVILHADMKWVKRLKSNHRQSDSASPVVESFDWGPLFEAIRTRYGNHATFADRKFVVSDAISVGNGHGKRDICTLLEAFWHLAL